MIKNFNYTDRKRITRKQARIEIEEGAEKNVALDLDLSAHGFPDDARVFIDAFTSGSPIVHRLDWGTVASPSPPPDRSLKRFGDRNLFFDLRVVEPDGGAGRLLGLAERVPAGGDRGQDPDRDHEALLPVNFVDLGEQLWKVSFAHDLPWLEINSEISTLSRSITTNPAFLSLVLPEVVRKILTQILIRDEVDDPDGDDGSWRSKWLKWGMQRHPHGEKPQEDATGYDGWIDDVVEEFCREQDTKSLWSEAYAAQGDSQE